MKRSRTISDPAIRQASIQAARAAFDEREAQKEIQAEEDERRAAEREYRKTQKADAKKKTKRNAVSHLSEKSSHGSGADYATFYHNTTVEEEDEEEEEAYPGPAEVKKKKGISKPKVPAWWMRFIVWLKTRLFKMRRTITRKITGKK